MRIIVMFDLPVETSAERRSYRKFRKYLIKTGFYMLQQSVYTKLVLNSGAGNLIIEGVKKHRPPRGLVQTITITEKQFSRMQIITGEHITDVVSSDERLIIL